MASITIRGSLKFVRKGSCLSNIVTGIPFLINCRPVHTPCIPEPIIPTDLHL